MSKYDEIVAVYPELIPNEKIDLFGINGCIELRDDGDGIDYISKWEYSKPIPAGLKLGK
jgi:hypothetical protein